MATATKDRPETFPELLAKYINKTEPKDRKEIKRSLSVMNKVSIPSLTSDKLTTAIEKRTEVQKKLASEFLFSSLQDVFPLMSPEFFNLRRYFVVTTKPTDVQYKVEVTVVAETFDLENATKKQKETPNSSFLDIPRIQIVDENQIKPIQVGRTTYTGKDGYGNLRQLDLSIDVEVPSRSQSGILLLKSKAISAYYEILGKMAKNCHMTTFAESIMKDPKQSPTFVIGWIPDTKALKFSAKEIVQDPDPALFMVVGGRHFLIGTWDIENEQSIDAYLREYSSGSMKDVVRLAAND